MLSRLSYSNVIATAALFLALCGSSYAALNLPKNSVGPQQLQKNSVTSKKVKKGSLLKSDFKKSQLASLHGPQGPQGAPGPSGATNVIMRRSAFQIIVADTPGSASVDCLPGEVATGGGVEVSNGQTRDMMVGVSRPQVDAADKPIGWYARAYNLDSDEDDTDTVAVRAYAICASP